MNYLHATQATVGPALAEPERVEPAPGAIARAAPVRAGDQVEVWLAFYHDPVYATLLPRLRALLSDEERQRETRFHFADDRQRYLVTRALVRSVLSRYAGLAPERWRFAANAYGRPEIDAAPADAADLRFNVSHTRGLIAMAVGRGRELGVDVEHLSLREVSQAVAERCFAREEVADLARVEPCRRQDRFFEYWTFKEAYIKARGMGLSLPLEQFSFHYPQPDAVRLAIRPELGDDAQRWSLWQYRPTPDYLLALCAERGHGAAAPRIRAIVPTLHERELHLPLLKSSERAAA